MDTHTGTHIDAPLHMIPDGEEICDYALDRFIRPAIVLDLVHVEEQINAAVLEDLDIPDGAFVLLKTRNSLTEDFDFDFVYLSGDAAEYLREIGACGVGIDALGIERGHGEHPAHRTLLGSGLPVLEGLRLAEVEAGSYLLIALPLRIAGADGSPVRAVLLEENALMSG